MLFHEHMLVHARYYTLLFCANGVTVTLSMTFLCKRLCLVYLIGFIVPLLIKQFQQICCINTKF